MKVRGVLFFFLAASAVCALILAGLSFRAEPAVLGGTWTTAPFGPDEAETITVTRRGEASWQLMRTPDGDWHVRAPFAAEADTPAVMRLLDALLLARPGDRLSAGELRRLGRRARDFGLMPPAVSVAIAGARRKLAFELGDATPSGAEVYVRLSGGETIYTLPAAAARAVPAQIDGFRRRQIFHMAPAGVVAADFRIPGAPFVKLVREGARWCIREPIPAAAEGAVVEEVLAQLLALRAVSFVRPEAAAAPAAEPMRGPLPKAQLVPFGLEAEDEFSVTLWDAVGASERIVFGAPSGTNGVYALVHGGTAVVTVQATVAEACRKGRAKFLDARVFPYRPDELASIAVVSGETLYLLARGTNGVWRLDSPVLAPADPVAAAALAGRVLSLKQNDLVSPGDAALSVSVRTTGEAPEAPSAPVALPAEFLPAPANLRAKQVLAFDPARARRLTVRRAGGAGGETVVTRADAGPVWQLAHAPAGDGAVRVQASAAGIARVLAALAHVEADFVANLNPARDDYARYGLAPAAFTIAADVSAADALRHTLLLGQAAPGGGRYAMSGGGDAIFILSREQVAELTMPLTESALENVRKGSEERK